MYKILIIARKEIISTFRQRNLILIMLLSPLVLVTIMGLAFSGVGGDTPAFATIPIAVVNQDVGFSLPLPDLAQAENRVSLSEVSFNLGDQVAALLLSQPLTATAAHTGAHSSLDFSRMTCPLVAAASSSAPGSLAWLFEAVALDDPAAARAAVSKGDFAAAVLIPPDFTRQLLPSFDRRTRGETVTREGVVEVYANNGTPISADIVRTVVTGIVDQYGRAQVALEALIATSYAAAASSAQPEAAQIAPGSITQTLQAVDAAVLAPLGCLFVPGASNIQLTQQPLEETQTRSPFGTLMVVLGSAQAMFFALFTGVFGINAIYEDRIQGTLQRLIVSPTPRTSILAGRLLGNLGVVMAQLLILLLAFTLMTTLVERAWTFIWGNNPALLLLVILGLSLFTTGLGVLIVGLARTSEQVQLIGPLITILLSILSGTFGTLLPQSMSQLSPIWWGIDALSKLAANEHDIGLHLGVLFGVGLLFAAVGTFFFRRRMDL